MAEGCVRRVTNMAEQNVGGLQAATVRSSSVCRFFSRGKCLFGDRCRFFHCDKDITEPATSAATTTTAEAIADTAETGHQQKQQQQPNNRDWVNAPEFVPAAATMTARSYANAAGSQRQPIPKHELKMCPYMDESGACNNAGISGTGDGSSCPYAHGQICELCGLPALHPYSETERKRHERECIQQHERDMELSFAVQRSKEKSCGVCFEVIMEKASREHRRFGILPNCNHCFCLACIRKWRKARQFDNKIIRACPECRVTSDFVCPSMYWVESSEDKQKLIDDYKNALARKDCKYFRQGRGKCPFGNKCFYLHALPDGTRRDVGPPPRQPRRHPTHDLDMLQQLILWDFLDERDSSRWLYSIADDLEDLVGFFSDSEDSDWSEYESFFD